MEGPSRRRLSGIVAACALVAASLAVAARADVVKQAGPFALYDGTQQVRGEYWSVPLSGTTFALKVDQTHMNDNKPVMEYGLSMGKTMHFFLIRDDFATMKHEPGAFNTGTGTFSHNFTLEPNHKYWLFTDSHIFQGHRQVFRYEVASVGQAPPPMPALSASPTTVSAGGNYTVNVDTTTLKANTPHLWLVVVDENGKAAENLTPEFGSAAIMVMVNTSTLQYISVHPLLRGQKLEKQKTYTVDQELQRQMANSQVGPNQQVEIPALPAGTYKVWYEFIGGVMQNKHAAPFTVVVQ